MRKPFGYLSSPHLKLFFDECHIRRHPAVPPFNRTRKNGLTSVQFSYLVFSQHETIKKPTILLVLSQETPVCLDPLEALNGQAAPSCSFPSPALCSPAAPAVRDPRTKSCNNWRPCVEAKYTLTNKQHTLPLASAHKSIYGPETLISLWPIITINIVIISSSSSSSSSS